MNRPQPLMKSERGVAAIEFALLIVLLLMIVGAIIEFGRVFWYYDALTKATRDGARLISMADKSGIASASADVQSLVVAAANSAGVSPALANGNVSVECLNASYGNQGCVNGVAPVNVRVSITGYNVTIGGLFPIFLPAGGVASLALITLAPHTTMRYMR